MKSSFTSPLIAKHFFWTRWLTPHQQSPATSQVSPLCLPSPATLMLPHSTPTVLSGSSSPTPYINLALTPGHKGGVQLLVSMGKPGWCFATFRPTAISPGLHIKAILSGKTQVAFNGISFPESKGRVHQCPKSRSFSSLLMNCWHKLLAGH